MKKNECKEVATDKKRFFIAVIDSVLKVGKVGETKEVNRDRFFNEKFVDSPEKALLIALDLENIRWKTDAEDLMKDVRFDAENNEYIVKKIFTTNWNTPTENQMKKYIDGEYEFYIQEYYIQIIESDLVKGDLRAKAVTSWNKITSPWLKH